MTFSKYIVFLFSTVTLAQSQFVIQGSFPQGEQKEIFLKAYVVQEQSILSKTKIDEKGNFTLEYPANYVGAALLEVKDTKSLIVLLNQENIEMQWDKLEDFKTLKFIHSPENDAFGTGLDLYQNTEGKRAGLWYLLPYYANEPQKQQVFQSELDIQNKAMKLFLDELPATSYAKYYLKIRKLIADMPQTASRYSERMPEHEKEFNTLDFADEKLLHSGLYNELLDAYVLLIESYGAKLYNHLNTSIDAILNSLKNNTTLKQDRAEFLFTLLEKRSLFPAAEHLALAMLGDNSCQLDSKHEALFEQYRKMAKGNTAPNILFVNPKNEIKQLSDINSKYKLVVFGASWCPKCSEEIPKLNVFYPNWKKDNTLEIVFISLDNERVKYESFIKEFPWISSCDYMGWEGKASRDYCVFGTPTMYLLDANNKIMVKPISPEQISAWLEVNK